MQCFDLTFYLKCEIISEQYVVNKPLLRTWKKLCTLKIRTHCTTIIIEKEQAKTFIDSEYDRTSQKA